MKQLVLKKLIRNDIAKMDTYQAVSSIWELEENSLKLDAGENPYGYSSTINKELGNFTDYNYYPDSEYKNLRRALAKYAGVTLEEIMVGNGSDEVLDLFLRLILNRGDRVINCPPTFGVYSPLIVLNRGIVVSVPRKEDFSLDVKRIKEEIKKCAKLVIVCNPNNPTGTISTKNEIIDLLETGVLVLIDEAYYEFCGKTVVPLVKRYPNLIVTRTLSKWAGIAGLRLGYSISSPDLVKQLFKIKPPYNVNVAAEIAAKAALNDLKKAKKLLARTIRERKRVYDELKTLPFLTVYPSAANLIYLKINENADLLKDYLQQNKLVVRYMKRAIRLTIGRPEQNNRVIRLLKEFQNKERFAFLDRDGTLIFEPLDTYQIDSTERLRVLDGVVKGLIRLTQQGYKLVMITNQDGLGTAAFPKDSFNAVQEKFLKILKAKGVIFSKILICPHYPTDTCSCRKPKTGLVQELIDKNGIDKSRSFVCGDRTTDKQLAGNLGIKFVSIKTNGNLYNSLKQGGIL